MIHSQKNWYSISELTSLWDCTKEDILHFGQSNDLELCFDWKKLVSKLESKYFFNSLLCFIECEFFFGPIGYKRPNVINEVTFAERQLWQLQRITTKEELKEIEDDGFVPHVPVEHHESSMFTRFAAINSELLFDLVDRHITLPHSNDLTLPKRIGFLGGYDFCIFTSKSFILESYELMRLNINDLIVTKMEKLRFESAVKSNILGSKDVQKDQLHLKTVNSGNLLEDDDTPILMVLASSLFDSVWKGLPTDMKKPTKGQLGQYIKTKLGITEQNSIDALIRVSKPDDVLFGGKQNPNLKEWKPKGERK